MHYYQAHGAQYISTNSIYAAIHFCNTILHGKVFEKFFFSILFDIKKMYC